MISTPTNEIEDKDLVQIKARDMQAIVDAMELINFEDLESIQRVQTKTSRLELDEEFRARLSGIDLHSLHLALESSREKLDAVIESHQRASEPKRMSGEGDQQSLLTKLATSLSSSATLGIAASALLPMAVGIPLVAAAAGAAVGWFLADKALSDKEK